MHPLEYRNIDDELRDRKKISILMPFLNEGGVIVGNTYRVIEVMKELGINFEIVLIDDGSTDDSYTLLKKEFSDHAQVKIVRNFQNFGKGWAIKTGYEFSTGDYILFLDSDLELSPYHLPNFLRIMKEENADAVIGSKLHKESTLDYPFMRRVLSIGYYSIIRVLFGLPIMDSQTGIKLFKREALEISLPRLLVKRFAFDIELLMLLAKYKKKISAAPIELNFSKGKFGKIRLKSIYAMFWDTLAIFYRDKFLRFYNIPLGINNRYKYTFVLFFEDGSDEEYQKENALRYLNVYYEGFRVIIVGKEKWSISDPKAEFFITDEEAYTKRMELLIASGVQFGDYVVLSSLMTYPDERFLLHLGRILSLENVGAIGGFTQIRNQATQFEQLGFSVIKSFFLNLRLHYRFRAMRQAEVRELQLDGIVIRSENLKTIDYTAYSGIKLEYVIAHHLSELKHKLIYTPDVILYKKFPLDLIGFWRFIREHSGGRARQFRFLRLKQIIRFSKWELVAPVAFILFFLFTLGLSIALLNPLFLIPLGSFYLFLLINRLFFYGFKFGMKSFGLLIAAQLSYGWNYITALFSKMPDSK